MASRIVPPVIAVVLGVGTGVYVFKPLLESYRDSTAGTFRPEDDHHAAAIPPLPMTTLQPAKTPDGKDLLPPPKEELPVEPARKV
ncbi:hypothetical protein JCM8115_000023 [Rhodotorula mucilaginosa]|uniref:Uncharacterized protein n=1 Tax=Rhodotorula mucilaginosa TaxID=5537 RepID=A0A9P6W682_RHOMI|nr:hypothetical protein C6P46_006462 [Rhodotorula mucilaginosa]TKA50741.1 hypothetical protein B0A53_06006 [Rhodotorula sp. CCFEE 5036]